MHEVRPAAVAGSWYPAGSATLAEAVDAHLAAAPPAVPVPCPRAIVAPHAGLMYSGPVAAYAYMPLAACTYDAAVLVGPSHFVAFDGVSVWSRGAWDTPFGPLGVQEDLAGALLAESPIVREYPLAHAREHSLEMQLPFLARLRPSLSIVPLLFGDQRRETAFELGDALARVLCRPTHGRVLLVASSDLSHYEDAATASRLDRVVLQHVEALDPDGLMSALEREPRHACGGAPIVAVLHASRQLGCAEARVLQYADSGDVSGDKSSVVGYAAAAVW